MSCANPCGCGGVPVDSAGVPAPQKRSLIPHEHGAYGQIVLPLVLGLSLGRPSLPALLLALGSFAAFLAYEPLLVAWGHRGQRAREADGSRARRAAAGLLLLAAGLGAAGFFLAPALARWAALVPPLLAGLVAVLVWRDLERTAIGEIFVATALSSAGYPVALAAGAAPAAAASAWVAWILAFACATLSVQALLGRARAASPGAGLRWAAGIASLEALAIGMAARTVVPWTVPLAVSPVALAALLLVVLRVPPRQLKRAGWTLLSATVAAFALLVVGLR